MAFSLDEKEKDPVLKILEPVWDTTSITEAQKAMVAIEIGKAQEKALSGLKQKFDKMAEFYSSPEKSAAKTLMGILIKGPSSLLGTMQDARNAVNSLHLTVGERDREEALQNTQDAARELRKNLLSLGIGDQVSDTVTDRFGEFATGIIRTVMGAPPGKS